ncbi:MAG: LamG domain-containing protein, partial [Magnetovibrio sp.]|nr:LamG domain-containing protein [Magnetovibrio sp.]
TISNVPDSAVLSAGTDNGDGTWTVDADDLDGLTITPPANSDEDFTLQVTAGGDVLDLEVVVEAVADAPTASAEDASGLEDTAIDLDLASQLTDTDGSESLSITISGMPEGATLSAGTDNGDGTWTLSGGDLAGLQITPPADSSDDFQLSVTATSTEGDGGDTATTTGTIDISVTGDADTASLSVDDASGDEDTAIALDIDASLTDTDGSETLSVTISDIPAGSTLTSGGQTITVDENGNADVDPSQLADLQITPPEDFNGSFDLTVTATTTEADGDTSTTSSTLSVDVGAVDDEVAGSTLDVSDAAGTEDTAISLDIGVTQLDTDGSESVSVTISGVPDGATLSAGTDNEDGTWTLDAGDLDGLQITPPADSNEDFSLDVTVTTTEANGGDSTTTSGTIDIDMTGDADTATLSASLGDDETDVSGVTYELDVSAALADTDGSETLSITISDVPAGVTLNAGTDNQDGTWTLEPGDLADLEMTVPDGTDAFDLSISATATEDDGDTSTTSATISVEATDTSADEASLSASDAAGSEDTAIALDIDAGLTDTDGSESLSITISGVPDGAVLSAGTDNEDGTWTLTAADLDGLTLTPPADSNADFSLGVSVTTTEISSGDTSTTTTTLDVDVTGVADAPTVSASVQYDGQESGETDVSVPQTISDAADTQGSTVTVSGVPDGATLSGGTDYGDGTWPLDAADLDNLTVTPADGASDDFSLSFDVSGSGGAGDTLFSDNFDDGVSGWGNEAESYYGYMDGGSMEIEQDEDATRTFDFGEEHAGQTVTISFDSSTWGSWDESGSYQDNFVVTANGSEVIDTSDAGENSYSVTVTLDENGQLQLNMNVDSTSSSEGIDIDNFQITAGDDWETSLASETVDVTPEPGGFVYDLDITAGLTDTDGSETLSVTVGNMPSGAELSAGTDNGDGTWTLSAGDLDGLQVTVPTDAGEFDLSVSATATEDDGDTNSVATSVSISTPDVVAEEANLSTSDASGEEDRAIALDIDASLADTDGSETLSITISGVPDGAELSAGTDNGDGSWTLESGDLADLTILPPTDSSDDFSLTVSATTTETSSGDAETVTSTIDVTVDGVADAAELSVELGSPTEVGGGATPVSYWNVDETTGLTLTDSVGNNDAESHGKSSSKDDLDLDDTGVFNTAAEFKAGDRQYMEVDHSPDLKPDEGALTMWFNMDNVSGSDMMTLASSDSSGYDDGGHFGLFIDDGELRLRMQSDNDQTDFSGGSVSSGEWNQVTVTWGDDGANVYLNGELVASDDNWTDGLAGNEEPWLFGANQWASGDGTANNLSHYFDGHMDDIAIYDQQLSADDVQALFDDGVQDVMDEGGVESLQYPLDISANLADTDGSESLGITIEGLPDGAVLSAGTDNGDGTWSVEEGDLEGLTVTVPADADDFLMSVSATVTDEGGDTRTAIETVQVDVGGDGFDAGTTGTSAGDTLTGSSGDDVISGEAGNDDISGGDGADTLLGGDGDDQIDGGDGDDVIDGGDGSDTLEGGAGDDHVMGGQGDDLFIFGAGDGADYFSGGDGWSDTVQIDDVSGGPGGDSGWTLQVDEGAGYTETESGIEFDAEASGVITLSDGSELTFDGVEKLEW